MDIDFLVFKWRTTISFWLWRFWRNIIRSRPLKMPPEAEWAGLPIFYPEAPRNGFCLAAPGGLFFTVILTTTRYQDAKMRAAGIAYVSILGRHYETLPLSPVIDGGRVSWGDCSVRADGLRIKHIKGSEGVKCIEFSTFARLMPTKSTEKA